MIDCCYIKTLPRASSMDFLFAHYSEVLHPNLQIFVRRRHVGAPYMGKVTEKSVVEFCY